MRKVATDFLSENKKANMQNRSRRQEESDENVEEHIHSGQGDNDDGDVDDNHENEVLISVNVTSADDDIQLQDEENHTFDDIVPPVSRNDCPVTARVNSVLHVRLVYNACYAQAQAQHKRKVPFCAYLAHQFT